MTVHIHPTSSARPLAATRPDHRWSVGHWVLVGGLSAVLVALVIAWIRVVPPLLADYEALTPFETPIAWLVTAAVSALTIAAACLTAAAAVWRPQDSSGSSRRT
jgi:hypothetical protein